MSCWDHRLIASAVTVLVIRFTAESISSPNGLIKRFGDVGVKFTATHSLNCAIISYPHNRCNTNGTDYIIEENIVESDAVI